MSDTNSQLPSLVLYNWNPSAQLAGYLADQAAVVAGTPGATATIAYVGDSTALGFATADGNFVSTTSPAAQLVAALNADGVPANQATMAGQGNELQLTTDARVATFGGGYYGPIDAAGGQTLTLPGVGSGFTFAPGPGTFDAVTVDYLNFGVDAMEVAVNGVTVSQIQEDGPGEPESATFALPSSEAVSSVTITNETTGQNGWVDGVSLQSATPQVQVTDDGVGGSTSGAGYGGIAAISAQTDNPINTVAAQHPALAIVNFGINDLLLGTATPAQIAANDASIVRQFQAVGTDVILEIPNPLSNPVYAQDIGALRAGVDAVAQQLNVPVIDLSATLGDNAQTAMADGLVDGDGIHPSASMDAQVAQQFAALLAPATAPITPTTTSQPTAPGYEPWQLPDLQVNAGGPDHIQLSISQTTDGSTGAVFAILVNGGEFGGIYTAPTAGMSQNYDLTGTFAPGTKIGLAFLNQGAAGAPGYLYLQGANDGGVGIAGSSISYDGYPGANEIATFTVPKWTSVD